MNFSRLLPTLISIAKTFASDEVKVAEPYAKKAYEEIPTDIVAKNPGAAFLATATEAWKAMSADPSLQPSFTGLLGAVAGAFVASFTSG